MVLSLDVRQLVFGYGDADVLRDITLPTMRSGEVTAVVGPNAAGKSTLLKCIAGLHSAAGSINLDGPNLADSPERMRGRWPRLRRHLADRILYTPQEPPPAVSISVFEAVLLARQGRLAGRANADVLDEIGSVLVELDLDAMATRPISDLSGGQRQLVGIAQAMIRKPAVMLLDEPTSSLDLRNQLQILELVGRVARTTSMIVVITVHDLGLAARFADRVVVLNRGAVHSAGTPAATITRDMLRDVYRIDAHVCATVDGIVTVAAAGSL